MTYKTNIQLTIEEQERHENKYIFMYFSVRKILSDKNF